MENREGEREREIGQENRKREAEEIGRKKSMEIKRERTKIII